MKHYVSKSVRCPFYHWEEERWICCEGVARETWLRLTFSTRTAFANYKGRVCCGDYETCPIAQMLTKKYEEEESK